MVLGQVTEITSRDLVLALPNNLIGFVPLTSISDKLTARVGQLVTELDESDGEDFEDIDLEEMFHIGQYLRAWVTSAAEDGIINGKTKKSIELSINPKLVNRGIDKSSVVVNGTIQVSVISNEDHGLVVDMGLDEPQLKGFLPKSELGQKVEHVKVQEGAVFLCTVLRLNSDGRIITLSADHQKAGNLKKLSHLSKAPTIDAFLPGTAVDLLVTDSTPNTLTGKIMGSLDATADIVHSGAASKGGDISEKHKIGSRVKARIICTFPGSEPRKVGVSILDHIVSLAVRMSGKPKESRDPLDVLPISSILEEAKVTRVDPAAGLYLDVGVRNVVGFAHISRLTDTKVDRLSADAGPYKLETKHRARVIGYNIMDGLFQVSLEQTVLEQPFLRVQDIKIGQIVKGKVVKLIIDKSGSPNVLVTLAEGITGVVPELHMADVRLQHPDRKFREGASVTARVLSTNIEKRTVRLTLKKSLVNSEVEPWLDYSSISVGDKGPGIIGEVKPNGASVQFYGHVRAWLPVSQMSEAFIEDATTHFKQGQVVNVRVLSVEPADRRMLVSCKDPEAVDADKEATFRALSPGDIVSGTVIEKSAASVTADLGHGVKGVLRIGHLTDGSENKNKSTIARVRVGGPLEDVVVLDKHNKSRTVILSNKPTLRKDAQARKMITHFEDVRAGETVHGFVRGILPDKVFVEFGGGIVGLLFQSQLPDEMRDAPNFGLLQDQSVTVRVTHVDPGQARFRLSMRPETDEEKAMPTQVVAGEATVNAVDSNVKTTTDLNFGTSTTVRVRSVKDTQLNVEVADNVSGRISVAEIFNDWDEIKDKKHPLAQFKMKDVLPVKVLGMHDARNHLFLPLTHREGKLPVFELTAKKGSLKSDADILTLHNIKPGSSHVAFINNIADRFVWVNLSANVRGRIELLDLSDDLSLLSDLEKNFPIGCALKVRVKAVDVAAGRLDLTATSTTSALELKDLKEGLVLPAHVTKVHDTSIVVQINKNIAGPIYLEQLADDYEKAKPGRFKLGDIVRVCVIDVDVDSKRIGLSARPSRTLNSSLAVKDIEINDKSELKVHQVVRGFVKKHTEKGLYIRLGHGIDAFVKVANLSDEYIKDWKAAFPADQLVTGKIIAANAELNNPQMTLKKSHVEGTYVKLLRFGDISEGQIVTAKVRKVEKYGVFLVIDDSQNISGLCHISEMADSRVENVKALYKEGDAVKAKVLEVDPKQRKIKFGLKYSYIEDKQENEDDEDEDGSEVDEDGDLKMSDDEVKDEDEDVDMRSVKSDDSDEASIVGHADAEVSAKAPTVGLTTSGFDWTGDFVTFGDDASDAFHASDSDTPKKKKKSKKPTITEDRTGDLDAHGPQSVADFERLLLGQPNSAELWVRYMVFQRELGEIEKARQIARRALGTMSQREEKERLDVWTALLHLENEVGEADILNETLREATQNNDSREVHERMIKIYVSSGKLDVSSTVRLEK
jgi:rRNA biogenesis protein RRP5